MNHCKSTQPVLQLSPAQPLNQAYHTLGFRHAYDSSLLPQLPFQIIVAKQARHPSGKIKLFPFFKKKGERAASVPASSVQPSQEATQSQLSYKFLCCITKTCGTQFKPSLGKLFTARANGA